MDRRPTAFLTGLFLTTLATLCLEVLDTRLLSVMSWYHLSFFAVSTAMFGMSAGALRVYLGGADFEGERAARALTRYAALFALSTPLSHVANLVIPLQEGASVATISAFLVTTIALAIPFYLSGVVVTVALTRIPGRIGLAYAVDLGGASLGALLVLPALEWANLSSATILCGALGAGAAIAFRAHEGRGFSPALAALVALLGAGVVVNAVSDEHLMPWYSKGKSAQEGRAEIVDERWNIHSQVMLLEPNWKKPAYWGPGRGIEQYAGQVEVQRMVIDGNAATWMTKWDGDPASLEWVRHDVTSLPYHLRKGADAAVIGVGGGRDLLTAIWAGSRSVKGVEINEIFLDLLEEPEAEGGKRAFAGIADRPEVTLVHDEARSFLTRTSDRYDVLQMSLIDTWAATGAGAFTLSENGLYTLEGWDVFLRVLKPDGIFSVSRWCDPSHAASETSRLLALATAALLERGITEPARHMILVACDKVATLLLSPTAFPDADLAAVRAACDELGFQVLVAPGHAAAPELAKIAAAATRAELDAAIAHPDYDYSPPTDERPFFFNFLRPESYLRSLLGRAPPLTEPQQGVLSGNLKATSTLLALFTLSLVLVVLVILVPLARSGLPRMSSGSFLLSIAYFACIGFGFMLVQVPFMQRFSVYLGHPTYAVVVILFSMILAAGIGAYISDRLPAERSAIVTIAYPLAIAAALYGATRTIQPVIDRTIESGLFVRALLVIALVAPVSLLLGLCFPIGMRLVRRISEDATPWMWGVNGACGVLGAVLAVGVSIWGGIQLNLWIATALYALLLLVAPLLRVLGARVAEPAPTALPNPYTEQVSRSRVTG